MRLPLFRQRQNESNRPSPMARRRLQLESLERREMLHGGEVFPSLVLETNVGDIPMDLLEDNAPGTVNNFLTYVQDNDYLNSIFHRLVPGFVLQGGGFTVNPAELCDMASCSPADVDPDNVGEVPTDPPIVNEFDVSNLRGTVAMAKTAISPDTATSQFFVSLANNSANLDAQNGGFTVFARVSDMTVVDQIAGFSTINLSSLFSGGDPRGAIGAAPVTGNQIVRVERVSGDAVIHGTVFLDTDTDSLLDVGEGGVANQTIYVDANNDGFRDSREMVATTNDAGRFHLRVEPGEHTIRMETPADFDITLISDRFDVALELGRSSKNRNFGIRYTGDSWTNPLEETDVDAVNGVNPTDILKIINELSRRAISDPVTGELPGTNTSPNDPTFYDVDGNGFVAPRDAAIIVNVLASSNQINAPGGLRESAVAAADPSIASAPRAVGTTAFPLVGPALEATTRVPVPSALPNAEPSAERLAAAASSPAAYSITALGDSNASAELTEAELPRAVDAIFGQWDG